MLILAENDTIYNTDYLSEITIGTDGDRFTIEATSVLPLPPSSNPRKAAIEARFGGTASQKIILKTFDSRELADGCLYFILGQNHYGAADLKNWSPPPGMAGNGMEDR